MNVKLTYIDSAENVLAADILLYIIMDNLEIQPISTICSIPFSAMLKT